MPASNDNTSDTVAIARPSVPTPQPNATNTNQRVLADRYVIERTIGTGGMGEIYLATDTKLQRKVAIKMMLHPEDDSDNKRFQLESQTVAGFSDPHTIRLFDYGITSEGYQYQVIEYLEGKNIKEYLKSHGPLHPTIAKSIAIQLCGSLAEAHRKNILHRDLKPSNIMLIDSPERGVQCKLLDFGLARADNHDPTMTKTGMVLGSPMYMSPEQIESKSDELTAQTDVYSLGLTLYTMVTGKQPFTGSSLSSILASQLFKQPTPLIEALPTLNIEPALCWIIDTAIQKKPEDRFISISQMKKAVELCLQNPEATLRLEDGELFCDEEFIQSYTSLSLQDISLAVENTTHEHIETIKQQRPRSFEQTTELDDIKENKPPFLFLGGLALIIGIVGFVFTQRATPTVTIQPTSIENTTPQSAAPTTPQEVATTLAIDIRSTPAGASIFFGNQYMGTTPSIIELKEADVNNADANSLTIRKEGFASETLKQPLQSGIQRITLKPVTAIPSSTKTTVKDAPKKTISPSKIKPKDAKKNKGVKNVTNPFEK